MPTPMKCDQCVAAMINGVFCHETGCPNTHKKYDLYEERWMLTFECTDCGSELVEGERCKCGDEPDLNDDGHQNDFWSQDKD